MVWTVNSPTDLSRDYRLGAGEATLDLSGLQAVDVAGATLPRGRAWSWGPAS